MCLSFSDLRLNVSVQCLTVIKSFRLSMVCRHGPESMDCYAFLMLINNSINKKDSFTLLILVIIEFYKRKYKKCRNLKQQRHFKTLCLFFLFSKE